jgi:hypothetical protein
MALPVVPHRRSYVDVGDEKVEVRSVGRVEGAKIQELIEAGDALESEIHLLAFGTDTDLDEARAWYAATPYDVVQIVLEEIKALSERRIAEASKSVS